MLHARLITNSSVHSAAVRLGKARELSTHSRPLFGDQRQRSLVSTRFWSKIPSHTYAMASPCRQAPSLLCAPLLRLPGSVRGPIASSLCRSYHSYDRPPPSGPFNPSERAILSAAYRHVPQQGFSNKALALGAKDAGFPDISASIVPEGPFSLIRYHLLTQREDLAAKSKKLLSAEDGAATEIKLGQKVERLTWERLLSNSDVIHRWQEALAIMAQPSYAPSALKELALLSDEIWFLAGDTSVDPSWYTKRATLATIYASSELFMTNDTSAGFSATHDFLQRRLAEVQEVGSALSSVSQWVGFTANAGINVLRSKGVRI